MGPISALIRTKNGSFFIAASPSTQLVFLNADPTQLEGAIPVKCHWFLNRRQSGLAIPERAQNALQISATVAEYGSTLINFTLFIGIYPDVYVEVRI